MTGRPEIDALIAEIQQLGRDITNQPTKGNTMRLKFAVTHKPDLIGNGKKQYWDFTNMRFVDCGNNPNCHFETSALAHHALQHAAAKVFGGRLDVEAVEV